MSEAKCERCGMELKYHGETCTVGGGEAEHSFAAPAGSATGTFIEFVPTAPNPKTKRWAVRSKDQGAQIGTVGWHGPWRKYCFMPLGNTVFEQVCLREVADFCEAETKRHREQKLREDINLVDSPAQLERDGGGW